MLAVFGFHLGIAQLSGGYLGVDLFFVLSGFLITSLILEEHLATARFSWIGFWGRRAKRLLPALFAMLIIVSLFTAVWGWQGHTGLSATDLGLAKSNGVASIFYVANWQLMSWIQHNPFDSGLSTDPFGHTWSLSIEEQFYWIWPFVIIGVAALSGAAWRRRGFIATAVIAFASAVYMASAPAASAATSAYFNSFARAFELGIGAVLAFLLAGGRRIDVRVQRALEWSAWPACVVLGIFIVSSGTHGGGPKPYMFRWGLVVCALLVTLVIAAVVVNPRSFVAQGLSWRPVVAIGIISYGIYLWHIPAIVLLRRGFLGLEGDTQKLAAIVIAFGLASGSYFLLERPLRRRSYTRRQAAVILPMAFAITTVTVIAGATPWIIAPTLTATVRTYPVVQPTHGAGAVPPSLLHQGAVLVDHPVDHNDPLRVDMVGDQLMQEDFAGLSAALASTGEVTSIDASSWNWTMQQSPSALKRSIAIGLYARPDVVLVSSMTDARFAADAPRLFATRVGELVHDWTDGPSGAALVVFLTPPERAGQLKSWMQGIEDMQRQVPNKVLLEPAGEALASTDGGFPSWLPPGNAPNAPRSSWVRVRSTDGNLCQNGTVRYATAVLAEFQNLFGLGPAIGPWWTGPWRLDRSYDLNPSSSRCPVDHPVR